MTPVFLIRDTESQLVSPTLVPADTPGGGGGVLPYPEGPTLYQTKFCKVFDPISD